jgi:hypothetical protein
MNADQIVGWGGAGDTKAEAVTLALGIDENYRKNVPIIGRILRDQIAATISFSLALLNRPRFHAASF